MPMSGDHRSSARVLAAGFIAGLLVEALLVLSAQVRAVESSLRADFKVLAALEAGVDSERRGVVEERLLAIPGAESAEFVTPEAGLARLTERDPAFSQAVALVGENPVPGVFEVRLAPDAVGQVAEWVKAAEAVPEVAEAAYPPAEARAIVELQFYGRWLRLVLSAAWAAALAAFAAAAWRRGRSAGLSGPLRRAAPAAAAAGIGWALGAGAALAAARPATHWAPAWPGAAAQAAALAGVVLGALGMRLASETSDEPARGRERRAAAAALAAALLAGGLPARAAGVHAQKKELEALSRELERVRAEAEKFRAEAGRAEKDVAANRNEQRRLETRIGGLRRELAEADGRRRSLGGRLAAIDHAHVEGRRRLALEVSVYARREPLLASAGSAGIMEDVVRRAAVRAQADYLEGVRTVHRRTANEHEAALRARRRLEKRTAAESAELERTRRTGDKAREAYEETVRKAGEAEARIRELEESRRALATMLRDLEKRESKAAQASFRSEPSMKPRSLPWPVRGKVVSAFGKRRVEELGTWSIHNGVEVAAEAGAQVHPVKAGEVVYSGPFRSYGNVVVVNHGGGFYSIYGRLDGPLQPKGAKVRPEVPLGAVSSREGKLYLELRQAGRALDPLKWLAP